MDSSVYRRRQPQTTNLAVVDTALHPLLATRWSPTRFDESYDAPPEHVELLLEAARWAPSAGNSQPWAFIVGRRGDETHQRLARHLARSSTLWATTASLLVANLSHRFVAETEWDYSEFSQYDLGQAVAHMTLQARSLGMFVRQFRAFDRDGIAAEFDVPAHWEVTTMSAIGRVPQGAGDPSGPPDTHIPTRQRRCLHELLWPAAQGE